MKQYIKEFGVGVFFFLGITRVMKKLRLPKKIIGKYTEWKHKFVEKYLWKKFGYLCKEEHFDEHMVYPHEELKAYVFWWQGELNAPPVVKMCIESLRKNCNLEVVCLSKDNYFEHINIPEYIVSKAQRGSMSLAHFSDVLRFALLYERGGIWIDATCLLTTSIPNNIFHYQFYSLNGPFEGVLGLEWKWTSFYMFGCKGNVLSKWMRKFYYEYWKEHECAITYLFLDCWITAMYQNCNNIKILIDKMPRTDMDVFALNRIMNMPYDDKKLQQVLSNSYIHKITYKEQYMLHIEGLMTNWGWLYDKENRYDYT